MPWLYWEDRGRDHLYSLDWTAGALVTVLSVVTLLGCMAWTRRRAGAPPSTRAAAAVMVAGVTTLGVTLVFTFGVAQSLAFEGMFGRRSSDLIERFAWPMMLQVWSSATAGLAVSGLGFRAARRGVSGPLAVGYLCLAGAANIALGYGVWLRPGDGMAVVDIQHPKAQLLGNDLKWVHDSADYVPKVEATLSGWAVVSVGARHTDRGLQIEARAVRGPLSSTRRALIPIVVDAGNPLLPLTEQRSWRFDEVAVDVPTDGDDALHVTPWVDEQPPRTLVIEVIAERWVQGRHFWDLRRTADGTSEQIEVYGSNGVWWTDEVRWGTRLPLLGHWLGQCVRPPPPPPDSARTRSLLCRSTHRHAWQLQASAPDVPGVQAP